MNSIVSIEHDPLYKLFIIQQVFNLRYIRRKKTSRITTSDDRKIGGGEIVIYFKISYFSVQ
jgi:hypothetical protein